MDRTSDFLQVRMLGGFELRSSHGRDAAPSGRKVRALFACLALSLGKPWTREKLMALLWSDRGEEQARASLRQALAELRRALGEPSPLRAEHDVISLDRTMITFDAIEFERLAKAGRLDQAAALYSGPLLDGHGVRDDAFEDWLQAERGRLHDLAIDVLDRLASSQAGDDAIKTAQRLLQLDAAREDTHRLLMRLYAASGQRAQALRQYQHCREALQRELQAQPDVQTERLYREIQDDAAPAAAKMDGATTAPAPAANDRPSIAVLPFGDLSGDPEQQYFSDGTTQDIITELSRSRDLFVIAGTSSLQYQGKTIDVKRAGRELGVQFVVEGSVRRVGERIRISAQLVDAASGNHLWAERYDRDVADILAVQEDVAQSVAATVTGRVRAAGRERALRLNPAALKAYDLVLRGKALILRYNGRDNEQSRLLAEKAVAFDPTSARAHALLSWSHYLDYMAWWAADRETSLARAHEAAHRAVLLDETDSDVRSRLGLVLLFQREYEESRSEFEKAIDLNPNDSDARGRYGIFLTCMGRPDAALEQFDLLKRHDPFDISWAPWIRGIAHFTAHRYEAAIVELKRARPRINEVRGWLAASYAHAGLLAEARATLEEFLRVAEGDMAVFPGRHLKDWEAYWHGAMEFRDQRDFDHLFAALSKAGLPT